MEMKNRVTTREIYRYSTFARGALFTELRHIEFSTTVLLNSVGLWFKCQGLYEIQQYWDNSSIQGRYWSSYEKNSSPLSNYLPWKIVSLHGVLCWLQNDSLLSTFSIRQVPLISTKWLVFGLVYGSRWQNTTNRIIHEQQPQWQWEQ